MCSAPNATKRYWQELKLPESNGPLTLEKERCVSLSLYVRRHSARPLTNAVEGVQVACSLNPFRSLPKRTSSQWPIHYQASVLRGAAIPSD